VSESLPPSHLQIAAISHPGSSSTPAKKITAWSRRPSRFRKLTSTPVLDPQRGYDQPVIEDPLKGALEEIAPKLDPELEPLAAALLAEEPIEDAWAGLLQEILDAA
jgi:hypothetical protein